MSSPVNRPLPRGRPTSKTVLTLARLVALGSAILAALALGLGTYPDLAGSPGPAGWVLPFILAPVLALGLAAGWHVVLGLAAHARETSLKVTAFTLGCLLTTAGVGTSAWFLAAKLGGSTAIQAHQLAYLDTLHDAERVASGNAANEVEIISALGSGGSGLGDLAREEAGGRGPSGKAGTQKVFKIISGVSSSFVEARTKIDARDAERRERLTAARNDIVEATSAVAAKSSTAFQEAVGRAATAIADADRIRLGPMLSGLNIGMDAGQAKPQIDNAVERVKEIVRVVDGRRRPLKVPVFYTIDAKEAVVRHPAPLPWIAAVLIEVLPLLMLGILLTLWRDPDPEDAYAAEMYSGNFGFGARLPQSIPTPAE